MASFSILDELLGTPNRPTDPGATSLISRLLEVVAYEATENETNIQTGYAIVKAAREKREKIDEALQALTENDNDEAAWESLTQSIDGIRKLEKLILDIGVLKPTIPLNLDHDTVQLAVANLTAWEVLRKRLGEGHRKVVEFVGTTGSTTSEPRQDDASILQTLVARLKTDGSITVPEIASVCDLLKDHSDSASKESGLESTRVLYAVRAAWLTHSAILEAEKAPAARKSNLNDDGLWKLGIDFMTHIKTLDEAALEAKYQEFLAKLLVNSTEGAPIQSIIKLIVASRKITRPFLSRNETLLKYCMKMVRAYNGDSAQKILQQGSVQLAIDEAMKAVKAAGESLPDMTTLDVETNSLQAAETAYTTAQAQVKDVLVKYSQTDADALDTDMTTAIGDDKDRIKLLKERCTPSPARTAIFQKTGITITNSPISTEKREYTNDTKIGALIWEARTKSNKIFTGLMQDGKLLDAHATIQSLDATKPLQFVEPV